MATERYLLGEMTGSELDDFEEHMFVCTECADAVKSGAAFTENARAVFQENPGLFNAVAMEKKRAESGRGFFSKWFSFPQLATNFAALALLGVVGYQRFVIIPALLAPKAAINFPLAAIARSEEVPTVIPGGVDVFTLELNGISRKCDAGCTAIVRGSKSSDIKSSDIKSHMGPAFDLRITEDRKSLISLTRAALAPGVYEVVVQPKRPGAEEVGIYPFRVRK